MLVRIIINLSTHATPQPTFSRVSEREPGPQGFHRPPRLRTSDLGRCVFPIMDLPRHLPDGARFPSMFWTVHCHPGQRSRRGATVPPTPPWPWVQAGHRDVPSSHIQPLPTPTLSGSRLEVSGRLPGMSTIPASLVLSPSLSLSQKPGFSLPEAISPSPPPHPHLPPASWSQTPWGSASETLPHLLPAALGPPVSTLALTKIIALATELSPAPSLSPHLKYVLHSAAQKAFLSLEAPPQVPS